MVSILPHLVSNANTTFAIFPPRNRPTFVTFHKRNSRRTPASGRTKKIPIPKLDTGKNGNCRRRDLNPYDVATTGT